MTEHATDTQLPAPAALALLVKLVGDLSEKLTAPQVELWTREALAAAMDVSLSTLAQLEASGGIGPQPLHLGGSNRLVRYRIETVRAWLAAGAPQRARWLAIEASKARRVG